MKILMLTDHYPPYYVGGYELDCYRIAEGLRSRNHEVVVLTSTYGVNTESIEGHVHRILSVKNFKLLGKWQRRVRDVKQMLMLNRDYRATKLLVNQFKPELVFVWNMSGSSLSSIFAVQDLGVETVFRIGSQWLVSQKDSYALDTHFFKKYYRLALLGFRRFNEINFRSAIMVSGSLKQHYQLSGFAVENAVVIPSGIPLEMVLENGHEQINLDKTVKLLIAGRLEYEKGTHIAVQALEYLVKRLGCEGVSLDFVGKGKQEFVDSLKVSISKSNLQNHVRFLGFLPTEELFSSYKEYDIVLFPSVIREGFPNIILESMSQGVPVIASDIGGPGDIIENGRNGLLVPPNNPEALATAIYELIQSPTKRKQMSVEAVRTVLSKFTFENMLDQYEAYLENVYRQGKHQ